MNKVLTTLAVSLGLAMSAMQSAQAITIDINGAAPGGVINGVESLDWTVGNALAVGAVPVAVGNQFTLLAHAALGNFIDGNGNPIVANFGLNAQYELTFVASFLETTTAGAPFPGAATFTSIAGPINYFEIWIGAVNANQGAGTGFNDGTRILSGTVLPGGVGNFSATLPLTNLDQFGVDNTPAIDSVGGAGGSVIDVLVQPINYDPNYFPGTVGLLGLNFNISNSLPFTVTNPSALFTNAPGGAAPAQPGATLASLGPINGQSGPNFQFQADANSSFLVQQVPEPATLGLLGIALVALGFGGRRRKRSVA